MKNKAIILRMPSTLLVTVALAATAYAQGPLTPSGAPAPTMRTLEQIEPRWPITNLPFTIALPGSYFLTRNLTGISAQNGITIAASGVTLDLMGFELVGIGGAGAGIIVSGSRINLAIQNGTVRSWPANGIDANNATDSRFANLRLISNGLAGLAVGTRSVVQDCFAGLNSADGIIANLSNSVTYINTTAARNASVGLKAGHYSTIQDCVAYSNSMAGIEVSRESVVRQSASFRNQTGFSLGDGSVLSHSTANENRHNGVMGQKHLTVQNCVMNGNGFAGLEATDDLSVTDSTAMTNGTYGIIQIGQGARITRSMANRNRFGGIAAGTAATVTDNQVSYNLFAGIHVVGDCTVAGNHVAHNTGAGILATSSKNVIQNNVLARNLIGLSVTSFGNFISGNKAVSSTSGNNYNISANNKVGVIVATPDSPAILGNTGGSGVGTTDPWANFSY